MKSTQVAKSGTALVWGVVLLGAGQLAATIGGRQAIAAADPGESDGGTTATVIAGLLALAGFRLLILGLARLATNVDLAASGAAAALELAQSARAAEAEAHAAQQELAIEQARAGALARAAEERRAQAASAPGSGTPQGVKP